MFPFMEIPPANWSPYSRADWTALQRRFRPPRDGPAVSILLRDYASPEEIDVVIAALQLCWRELGACARGANRTATRRMSAAAQDAALAAMWAAADRRRIGWILGYLRKCIVHRDYRNYAGLLPEGSASGYSRSSMPSTSSRGRPRSKIYVKRGARLQSMMLLGRVTCDTSFSRELADSSNIEAPIEHTFI